MACDSLNINLKVMLSQKDIKQGSGVYRYVFRKIIGISMNDRLTEGARSGRWKLDKKLLQLEQTDTIKI